MSLTNITTIILVKLDVMQEDHIFRFNILLFVLFSRLSKTHHDPPHPAWGARVMHTTLIGNKEREGQPQEQSVNNSHEIVFVESLKLWGFQEPGKSFNFFGTAASFKGIYIGHIYLYWGSGKYYF